MFRTQQLNELGLEARFIVLLEMKNSQRSGNDEVNFLSRLHPRVSHASYKSFNLFFPPPVERETFLLSPSENIFRAPYGLFQVCCNSNFVILAAIGNGFVRCELKKWNSKLFYERMGAPCHVGD